MRRTITISVSEQMHEFIVKQSGLRTVSEYIRSLISHDYEQHAQRKAQPTRVLRRANDVMDEVPRSHMAVADREGIR